MRVLFFLIFLHTFQISFHAFAQEPDCDYGDGIEETIPLESKQIEDVQDDVENCSPLMIGETRDVLRDQARLGPFSTPNSPYQIKRITPREYQIHLDLKLKPTDRFEEKQAKEVLAKHIEAAQVCLDPARSRFIAPSGESFTIQLDFDPAKTLNPRKKAPLVRIKPHFEKEEEEGKEKKESKIKKVSKKNQSEIPIEDLEKDFKKNRARARMWVDQEMDCFTIKHEVLHLLGLHDEYKEKHRKTALGKPVNDCRWENPGNNVMKSEVNTATLTLRVCECPKAHFQMTQLERSQKEECESKLLSITSVNQICPQYATGSPISTTLRTHEEILEKEQFCSQIYRTENRVMICSVTYHATYLHQGQMDAILRPGCKGINKQYYACKKNLYRTSFENGGTGCDLKAKKICEGTD